MAEDRLNNECFSDKGTIPLFGDPDVATEHLRDHLANVLSPLACHLELVDDLAANDRGAMLTALVAKALLRQVNVVLDQLHEHLRQAGVGIYVGAAGRSWEPEGVVAMVMKALPGKVEVASHD